MDVLMKLFWLYALRLPKGSGAEYDQWSHELLAQVDEQYAAWERLYDRIRSNNRRLGALEMVRYSTKEREQIDIFIANMAQFAPLIRGERGKKIAALHLKTLEAVSVYDNFHSLDVFTSARESRSPESAYVVH